MDFDFIRKAMAELEEEELFSALESIMADGGTDAAQALEAMQTGMQEIGAFFEAGDYFVADLIYAGEIMAEAMEIIKPALGFGSCEKLGRMLMCTVKDDLHDIGKNIVKAMLEASGLEVLDLGIDTPADKIVETARAEGIKIIALSGVLTLALDSMKATVEAFKAAGIRDDVKIIIGGAPVSEEACANTGADAWAHSPQKTVEVCTAWAKG